ncbi:MAG: dihydrofolate reductase [Flavobacterium sp.]|nr:MAG: dihydrofolate reductase [Flavobacterium sp.]
MIILIAAIAENNALGKDNQLPWHLPDDFKRFKSVTSGHYIIMGRKTFESFPKPLPNRTHVVITRQKDYQADGCIIVDSIEKALEISPKDQDVFVIGGGEIFTLAMPFADKLDITQVHASVDGDAFFPEIRPDEWKLESSEFHPKDEKHAYDFTFSAFIRK